MVCRIEPIPGTYPRVLANGRVRAFLSKGIDILGRMDTEPLVYDCFTELKFKEGKARAALS
jgi:hypothetical protein